jgi:plastocyanin
MKIVTIAAVAAIMLGFSPARATNFTVDIQNFAFVPAGRHIVAGDMITWTNRDGATHTATSDNGVWNSGNLSQGQSFSFTFNNAGTFPYHCAIHTFMKDTIFVSTQTGIGDNSPATPNDFELLPNYPNPFNNQTLIRYALPQPGHVTVDVYNLLGQKISSLADEDQAAGSHELTWSAPDQDSGIFFYRVTVDDQTKTGRMVLLK